METIRVLICDDQEVICEGLQTILGAVPGLEVVGAAFDGSEAIDKIPITKPDVVLMDLKMPGMNGIQATRLIRERFPTLPVLVLTTYEADEWLFDAIRAGAAGYLLKDSSRSQLVEAIKGAATGQAHIDPNVAGKLLDAVAHLLPEKSSTLGTALAEREREVLGLLAQGLSNAEIADRLHLSIGTVRNHVSAILAKLGAKDRTQAAILALRHGLVEK